MLGSGFHLPNHGYDVLAKSNVSSVAGRTGHKAVQLGMLGLVEESNSILHFLAEQSDRESDKGPGSTFRSFNRRDT